MADRIYSPAYYRRVISKLEQGFSRSQLRGHAKATELPLTIERLISKDKKQYAPILRAKDTNNVKAIRLLKQSIKDSGGKIDPASTLYQQAVEALQEAESKPISNTRGLAEVHVVHLGDGYKVIDERVRVLSGYTGRGKNRHQKKLDLIHAIQLALQYDVDYDYDNDPWRDS
jgi:hypothetical protein